MQHALRPYATAGAAIVGASLIAVTPLAAPVASASTLADVSLTAGETSQLGDLMAPWIAQYNTAATNASQLANNFFLAPHVGVQQWIKVQSDLWQQLLNDPSKAGTITDEMQENWKTLATAFSLSNADSDLVGEVTKNTVAGEEGFVTHSLLLTLLPNFLPASIPLAEVQPIINFLASPLSGIMIGALGPSISPLVALQNSITEGDNFNQTMANMVGAHFNGATMNLDSLIPLIKDAGVLPASLDLTHLEFAFGGVLSPGLVQANDLDVFDSSGHVVANVTPVGGSIFNSLGLTLEGVPLLNTIDLPGHAVGPIAAMEAWQQIIGNQLGSGWDEGGKNTGALAQPPGATITFPQIPTDYFGPGNDGGAAAASFDSALAELFSGSGNGADLSDQLTDLFNTMPGGDAFADLVNGLF